MALNRGGCQLPPTAELPPQTGPTPTTDLFRPFCRAGMQLMQALQFIGALSELL